MGTRKRNEAGQLTRKHVGRPTLHSGQQVNLFESISVLDTCTIAIHTRLQLSWESPSEFVHIAVDCTNVPLTNTVRIMKAIDFLDVQFPQTVDFTKRFTLDVMTSPTTVAPYKCDSESN